MEQPQQAAMNAPAPLLCVRCEYDVTSIPHEGVCPECGLAREQSSIGGALAFAPREHIHALASAFTLIAAACGAWLFGKAVPLLWLAVGANLGVVSLFGMVGLGASTIVAFGLAAVGTFQLTRPDPRPWLERTDARLRFWCRRSVLALLLPLILYILPFSSLLGPGLGRTIGWVVMVVIQLGPIAWAMMVTLRLRQLARLIPDTWIERSARAWLFAIPFLVFAVAAGPFSPMLVLVPTVGGALYIAYLLRARTKILGVVRQSRIESAVALLHAQTPRATSLPALTPRGLQSALTAPATLSAPSSVPLPADSPAAFVPRRCLRLRCSRRRSTPSHRRPRNRSPTRRSHSAKLRPAKTFAFTAAQPERRASRVLLPCVRLARTSEPLGGIPGPWTHLASARRSVGAPAAPRGRTRHVRWIWPDRVRGLLVRRADRRGVQGR